MVHVPVRELVPSSPAVLPPRALTPRALTPRALTPRALWNRHWPLLLPAVGRRLKWRLGRGPVTFTVHAVSVSPGLPGRLRSVRLTLVDVDVDQVRLDRVDVLAHGVRLRGTSVQAEHVELRLRLDQAGLDALIETGMPYAKLRLDGDVGRAELLAHPRWGHVELSPQVDEGGLVLHPTAVGTRAGGRWTGPARLLPRLRIGAEVLLPGSHVRAAEVRDGALHLEAEMEDVTLPLKNSDGQVRNPSG
jgi:hypothetical protein